MSRHHYHPMLGSRAIRLVFKLILVKLILVSPSNGSSAANRIDGGGAQCNFNHRQPAGDQGTGYAHGLGRIFDDGHENDRTVFG
jgi:hypothetical protein